MKKYLFFCYLLLIGIASYSQNTADNYCWKKGNASQQPKFLSSIDVLAGFVPNSDYNALKIDLVANNIFLKFVGLYTSAEKGVNSSYFANTWGINVSVFRFLYLFAGVDIFSSYGLISNVQDNTTNGIRKEIGLGLYPVKNLTLRLGYSFEIEATITIGYRFLLNKKVKKKGKIRKLPAYFKNVN
jgi:hypothetical protein